MEPINVPIQSNLTNAPLDLGAYFSNIVGVALTLAALAAFAYLVMGGIQWITAGGDKNKIEHSRDRITNAIIGLAIVAVSWGIFLIVDHFFGLGIAGSTSPSGGNNPNPGNSATVAGIGFICTTTSQCDKYCSDSNYYTVRYSGLTCGANTIGCACVHKTNPKVNPCPAGLSCQ